MPSRPGACCLPLPLLSFLLTLLPLSSSSSLACSVDLHLHLRKQHKGMLQLQNHHEAKRTRLHLSANKELTPSGKLRHSCGRASSAPEQHASSRQLCEDLSPQKHTATARGFSK